MWLTIYCVVWIVKFALFGMQRASLLISRNAGIEWHGGGKLLLPTWYPLSWLVIIASWGLLIAIALFWSWKLAIALWIGSYLLGIIVPIPYSAYKGVFQRRIDQVMHQNPVIGIQLKEMLDNSPF